jgi:DNA helicase HerA-like ATPase
VPIGNPSPYVLYQLSSAVVERSEVKGGSHLVVRATGNQLGVFNEGTLEFKQHRWVSSPGGPIYGAESLKKIGQTETPDGSLLLGHVIGTDIPIFLNCSSACEGHVALLGMTKMGKSTLAARIAQELSQTRRVTILDQTGEYVSKKGFAPCNMSADWKSPGVSVFEPKPGEVAADRALNFLEFLVKIAVEEYKVATPFPRVVIIDEAHQFIPEPAGLGFQAPGRDSSFKIGLLLMQIRKFGISVFLISQRTAVVAKSALSQCENLIAFRSVDQTGLDYLEAIAGGEIRSLLPQLRQGEALVFGPAISADGAVAIQVAKPQVEA